MDSIIDISPGTVNGALITTVEYDVNLTHLDPTQLSVRLVHPNGTTFVPITDFSGTPVATAAFNGLTAAGDWRLEIDDNVAGVTGTLNAWNLRVVTNAPADLTLPGTPVGPIPDATAGMVSSPITVEFPFTINGLVVTPEITHPRIGDLMAWVISPAGTRVMVTPLDGSPVVLTDFDGQDAQGDWMLEVQDKVVDQAGTLTSWTLGLQVVTSELMIWIDGLGPQRPTINLENADDTGMSNIDNVTQGDPTVGDYVADFLITSEDLTKVLIKDGTTVINDAITILDPNGGGPGVPAYVPIGNPADFDALDLLDGVDNGLALVRIDFTVVETMFGIPAEGPHPLSTHSFDNAGNFSAQSDELLVEIDTIDPNPSQPALASSSDSVNPHDPTTLGDNKTNKMQPAFVGTAEANAKIRIYAHSKDNPVLDQQQPTNAGLSNSFGPTSIDATFLGQSFTVGTTGLFDHVDVQLAGVGNGDVTMQIFVFDAIAGRRAALLWQHQPSLLPTFQRMLLWAVPPNLTSPPRPRVWRPASST